MIWTILIHIGPCWTTRTPFFKHQIPRFLCFHRPVSPSKQSIPPTKTHPAAHPSSVQHRPGIPGSSGPDRQGYPNSPGGIDPRSPGPTAVATPLALATGHWGLNEEIAGANISNHTNVYGRYNII